MPDDCQTTKDALLSDAVQPDTEVAIIRRDGPEARFRVLVHAADGRMRSHSYSRFSWLVAGLAEFFGASLDEVHDGCPPGAPGAAQEALLGDLCDRCGNPDILCECDD